ncbi:MAG: type I pullulanase [Lactobacillaceae bacterium]|nr:type I pullulanase [Lactobacillaceae bacterium]
MNNLEIDQKYYYQKNDLGAFFTPEKTIFKLWAPTATKVELVEYDNPNQSQLDGQIKPMDVKNGVWFFEYLGNHSGMIYTFRLYFPNGIHKETYDPYAFGAIANGNRSVVIDFRQTPKVPLLSNPVDSPTKAVISEMHVRDITVNHPDVPTELKGSYLGATYIIPYLKKLGINYVQFQPLADFATVDELQKNTWYNWGYDPQNYNLPEGSYSTNPQNPYSRINELKEMITQFHQNGIGIIMDVVYNHVYLTDQNAFSATVPNYYYRKNADGTLSNGSGINNDTASENLMFRKYMTDSLSFWAREYKIDGFRFDLLGIHDVETMNQISDHLHQINKHIILYGEGWELNTALDKNLLATQKNAAKMPTFGFFNDEFRNSIKGDGDSNIGGFVNGIEEKENFVVNAILGKAENGSYVAPSQLINYVEAHDNLNLNDKLWLSSPKDDLVTHSRRVLLATSLVFLSRGVPFIEIGQEFMRSKLGNFNSYNAGDFVNAVNWGLKEKNSDLVDFISKIINFRLSTSLISNNYDEIKESTDVIKSSNGLIVFELDQKYLIVISNGPDYKIPEKYFKYNSIRLASADDGVRIQIFQKDII